MYKVRKPTPPKLMLMSSADIVEVDSVALQQILIILKKKKHMIIFRLTGRDYCAMLFSAFPDCSLSIKYPDHCCMYFEREW